MDPNMMNAMMQQALMSGMMAMMGGGASANPTLPGLTLLAPGTSSAAGAPGGAPTVTIEPAARSAGAGSSAPLLAPAALPPTSVPAAALPLPAHVAPTAAAAPQPAPSSTVAPSCSTLALPGALPATAAGNPFGAVIRRMVDEAMGQNSAASPAPKKQKKATGNPDNRIGHPRFMTFSAEHAKKCLGVIADFVMLLEVDATQAFVTKLQKCREEADWRASGITVKTNDPAVSHALDSDSRTAPTLATLQTSSLCLKAMEDLLGSYLPQKGPVAALAPSGSALVHVQSVYDAMAGLPAVRQLWDGGEIMPPWFRQWTKYQKLAYVIKQRGLIVRHLIEMLRPSQCLAICPEKLRRRFPEAHPLFSAESDKREEALRGYWNVPSIQIRLYKYALKMLANYVQPAAALRLTLAKAFVSSFPTFLATIVADGLEAAKESDNREAATERPDSRAAKERPEPNDESDSEDSLIDMAEFDADALQVFERSGSGFAGATGSETRQRELDLHEVVQPLARQFLNLVFPKAFPRDEVREAIIIFESNGPTGNPLLDYLKNVQPIRSFVEQAKLLQQTYANFDRFVAGNKAKFSAQANFVEATQLCFDKLAQHKGSPKAIEDVTAWAKQAGKKLSTMASACAFLHELGQQYPDRQIYGDLRPSLDQFRERTEQAYGQALIIIKRLFTTCITLIHQVDLHADSGPSTVASLVVACKRTSINTLNALTKCETLLAEAHRPRLQSYLDFVIKSYAVQQQHYALPLEPKSEDFGLFHQAASDYKAWMEAASSPDMSWAFAVGNETAEEGAALTVLTEGGLLTGSDIVSAIEIIKSCHQACAKL